MHFVSASNLGYLRVSFRAYNTSDLEGPYIIRLCVACKVPDFAKNTFGCFETFDSMQENRQRMILGGMYLEISSSSLVSSDAAAMLHGLATV